MLNLVLASLGAGVLFGAMDAGLNANPRARKLHAVYAPLAKTEINVVAGIAIDLAYGFVIVLVFHQLAPALPGETALVKGLALGLGMWVFRGLMSVVTTWMTLKVPAALLFYQLVTGLAEMLVLGAFVGLTVRLG